MSAVSQVPPGTRSNGDNSAVRDSKTDPIELEQLSYTQALIQSVWRWIKGLQAIFTDSSKLEFSKGTLREDRYLQVWHEINLWLATFTELKDRFKRISYPTKIGVGIQHGAISTLIRKNSY